MILIFHILKVIGSESTRWSHRYHTVIPFHISCVIIQFEGEILGEDWLQSYATEILDAKYEFSDVMDVVNNQHHLDENQKKDLLQVLQKHQKLFDGTLGVYPHKKFHIDIEPNAKLVYARPYPVPLTSQSLQERTGSLSERRCIDPTKRK